MIGIIGAMEQEVAQLKEAMEIEETVSQAAMSFCRGRLCGKDVVVVQSGIGKVNAGLCAQILVDKFHVDVLINTGVAGALATELNIGDMVISTDAVQHDMDVTRLGYQKGQIPDMDVFAFPADSELVKKAEQANREANPDIATFVGRVASGDQFIAAIAQAAHLNQVSYVIIRAISDKADNSATMDYPTFERQAIAHSVRLVQNLLPRI